MEAELALRAYAESQAVLDDREVLPPATPGGGWRETRRAALRAGPGMHELIIAVRAKQGPPALWAQAPDLGLFTGARWEASVDSGSTWAPARPADEPFSVTEFDGCPSAARGFWTCLPWLLPFLAAGAWLGWRGVPRGAARIGIQAAALAWLGLGAACLLGPRRSTGFDGEDHLRHIRIVADEGHDPSPEEGWQLFEPPLHFHVAAWLRRAARPFLSEEGLDRLMCLPSLVCGFALAAACLFAVRVARPHRDEAALAALLVGAFLPASLTVALTPANQAMAGALAGGALVLALAPRERSAAEWTGLGVFLGAAALAKATAFVSLPLLLAASVYKRGRASLSAPAAFIVGFVAVAGWHYGGRWLVYGRPVLNQWDVAPDLWQSPGFRTSDDFLRFGRALVQPVYAGLNGFWDAFYSTLWLDGWQSGIASFARRPPPWPLQWQAALAWWGLVPSVLAARGIAHNLRSRDRAGTLALLGLGCGLAALLWLFMALPIYSTVKASYLLGLTPALALLVADGLDKLPRSGRAAAWAGLFAWSAACWRAFMPF